MRQLSELNFSDEIAQTINKCHKRKIKKYWKRTSNTFCGALEQFC